MTGRRFRLRLQIRRRIMTERLAIVRGRRPLLFERVLVIDHATGMQTGCQFMLYLRRHLAEIGFVNSTMLRCIFISHYLDIILGEDLLLLLLLLMVLFEERFVADSTDLAILLL